MDYNLDLAKMRNARHQKIVELVREGYTDREIALHCECSVSTIYNVKVRYNAVGLSKRGRPVLGGKSNDTQGTSQAKG